jgi:pimeloyl-ACP methyl ester carboxylesterase
MTSPNPARHRTRKHTVKAARLLSALALAAAFVALADGPGDNVPDKVRPVPPAGIVLPRDDVKALKTKLNDLGKAVAALPAKLKGKQALLELIPDVEVFHKAVKYALEMNQFYGGADAGRAHKQLDLGLERAKLLAEGKPTWTTATGLVVRGYRSRIDGSVQPYGLVVPSSYRPGPHRHRLDVWLHGRGETSGEVQFINDRMTSAGRFTPRDAFVLHPYGRYCNAFKFAGEIDVLEALEHVKRHYPIDDDRLVMRGFSMGGAGCWQFAVHYPDHWCAAAPGAGFSETPDFLKVFQKEKLQPPPYEKTLWQLYDCDGYAANLFNLPTVAYSGDKDSQKQAADVMEAALKKEGISLVHVIGVNVGHDYTPRGKAEVDRRIDRLAASGRDRVPPRVRFTTPTLRYNRSFWVRIDSLVEHWKPGSIDAVINKERGEIAVTTKDVTAFSLSFAPGEFPLAFAAKPLVKIDDGVTFTLPRRSDRSLTVSFHRDGEKWLATPRKEEGLAKQHGLQGPIDDAFMDRFLFVRPTGKAMNEKTETWVKSEMARAIREWRRHFRGDAIVKDDKEVTDADLANSNVVLWGDPSSNKILEKIAAKLPIEWGSKTIAAGEKFDAATHVVLCVYPNPLSPTRYVVLNSGFTFREYDYLNNARQTPKLPDYAVIDVTTPPSYRWPGKVAAAGFFDEQWRLKAK